MVASTGTAGSLDTDSVTVQFFRAFVCGQVVKLLVFYLLQRSEFEFYLNILFFWRILRLLICCPASVGVDKTILKEIHFVCVKTNYLSLHRVIET